MTPTDAGENLVTSIALTLFMLSLITEKISNFFKLNLPKFYGKIQGGPDERKRERNIQLLSALIGTGVAFACKADFFLIIKSNGQIEPFTGFSFNNVIGCIITGLFLSQGSKFFHDLLDTLLYFKNTRKSIFAKQEIENSILQSQGAISTDALIKAVTADARQDDEDQNQ